jgi:hypothetical protein
LLLLGIGRLTAKRHFKRTQTNSQFTFSVANLCLELQSPNQTCSKK